ncbi:MAG: peptide chain release factor N(5)-glutamine methyltransferase [Paludibacter sp.]
MQQTIQYIKDSLSGIYLADELEVITYQLMSEVTGLTRTAILINKNTKISETHAQLIKRFVNELKNFKPLQYVVGKTEFFGLPFKVNEYTLIPRPETEELVEWIIDDYNAKVFPVTILDIGTGSGCIPVSLRKYLALARVDGCDISPDALKVAAENAQINQLDVNFFEIDILSSPVMEQKWDVIVSNPPYIPMSDMSEMYANVLQYEPHVALFVADENPLIFYRAIALFALKHLQHEGSLYFEIHYKYGAEVLEMLRNSGFVNVQLRKDLSGNDRMVKAQKP